ncbi:regulator of nonsense transcripts 1-like [Artemia franciscana]|uniref:regulator of nonsense transcripts 1-like n=1 Tax=Artemia franciscana TaxID=6661 RepID=UPI0032DB6439
MDNRFEYLGPEHKKVMKHIVTQCLIDKEPVICVLQGPPGCGKTFVMASTILQLLFVKPECKILLCSLSETVLVEMIRKLHEQMEVTGATFKILGLGIVGDAHKDLQFILENQAKKGFSEQLISLQGHADSNTKDMIRNARVLATAFSYSESSSLELIIKETEMVFDFCIVDEANHCTEIDLLQPLTYGVRKLILVGDRKQLKPNIMSKAYANIGHFKSFFSRFINAVEEENVLSIWTQYRMHPAISYFPSRMFYNGNISNGTRTDKPLGVRPYIVIDVADRLENIDGMYPLNKPVAYLTARLVEMLATVDDLETIGVITPSHRHKFSVLKELQSRDCSGAKSVQVDIVKGFQGREKHAIVISATRDSKKGIGSFSEPEKFNVALTRAKHCLIICGHMATLRRNDLWNKLVTDAEKRELFYRVDSYSSACTLGNVLFGSEGYF